MRGRCRKWGSRETRRRRAARRAREACQHGAAKRPRKARNRGAAKRPQKACRHKAAKRPWEARAGVGRPDGPRARRRRAASDRGRRVGLGVATSAPAQRRRGRHVEEAGRDWRGAAPAGEAEGSDESDLGRDRGGAGQRCRRRASGGPVSRNGGTDRSTRTVLSVRKGALNASGALGSDPCSRHEQRSRYLPPLSREQCSRCEQCSRRGRQGWHQLLGCARRADQFQRTTPRWTPNTEPEQRCRAWM